MDNVRPLRPKKKPAGKPRSRNPVRRRVITGIIVAVVVLVLAFGSRMLGMYVDWLGSARWASATVFWTRIGTQLWSASPPSRCSSSSSGERGSWRGGWPGLPRRRGRHPPRAEKPRRAQVGRYRRGRRLRIGGVHRRRSRVRLLAAGARRSSTRSAGRERCAVRPRHLLLRLLGAVPQGVLSFVMAALIAALVLAAAMHLIMGGIDVKQRPPKGAGAAGAAGPSPFARVQQQAPQYSRRSTSSWEAARSPTSRRSSPPSSSSSASASCSAPGTCCTRPPARPTAPATPTSSSVCLSRA